MALGRSSISGVTEGAEARRDGAAVRNYRFGSNEARRDAGPASARRAGRIGNGVSEQSAISRNFASKGDDLSEALRGAVESNGYSSGRRFLWFDFGAAVGAAGFFKTHWYDGPHPLGAVD